MIDATYFISLPIRFQSFAKDNGIGELTEVIDSELEKDFNETRDLIEINNKIENLVKEILELKEAGRGYELDSEEYEDEINYCKAELSSLYERLSELDREYWLRVKDVPNIQCTKLLIRMSSGSKSSVILFERDDKTLCWSTYAAGSSKQNEDKYEKIDYYSEEELGKVGPAGREFYKKNPNAAPPGHFDRYPEDLPEGFNPNDKEEFSTPRSQKSFSERIEEDVDILDNRNRTPNDTEEISKLWDYWTIIKTAQLFAGPNANDESASCYKADLELIKQGVRPTQCQDDEELILLCDELQRISDEVNKLKGVVAASQKIITVEICKCGSGKTINQGYYQEGKLVKCCEDCVKKRQKIGGRFDYTCSSCWKSFRDVSFSYLNKEGKLVCDGCK